MNKKKIIVALTAALAMFSGQMQAQQYNGNCCPPQPDCCQPTSCTDECCPAYCDSCRASYYSAALPIGALVIAAIVIATTSGGGHHHHRSSHNNYPSSTYSSHACSCPPCGL